VRTGIINRIGLAAVAAFVAVGALAVAGCGGGGDDSSTTGASGASGASGSTPLSQDEFVSQANAACADANQQVESLTAPADSAPIESLAPFLEKEVAIAGELLGKLSAITPPEDLQSDYDEFLASGKSQIATAQDAADAAKSGDTQAVQAAVQELSSNKDDQMAKSLGLTECAQDAQPQQAG
jgi:hypothetical protein